MDIRELLELAVSKNASDLHITTGISPVLRIGGELVPLENWPSLTDSDTSDILAQLLNDEQKERFIDEGELDLSYGIRSVGRFRISAYRQRGSIGIAIRIIPFEVRSLEELGLPPIIRTLCTKRDGLILVTGPTGSGKSTTLASMIDIINSERKCVVITLEDPIEYLHPHKKSIINQREVGSDTKSFERGLRAALREDPDVILVGEMRDLETIATAITAAETGHLVLSTLHTKGAAQTIDRIVDVFPPHQQQQIRIQLAGVLEAVISQQLIKRYDRPGVVPAIEVMIGTPAIRNLIREGKTHQIRSVLETGWQFGMQTLERSLKELLKNGVITSKDVTTRGIML